MSAKKEKYKAVLLGCGGIGYQWDKEDSSSQCALTHFKALQITEQIELVAVCDERVDVLSEIQSAYSIPGYQDLRCLFHEHCCDIVTIATPDFTHESVLEYILELESPPSFVFVEKPIGLELSRVERIVSQYRQKGIFLEVNYIRRFCPGFCYLRKKLDEGAVGDIQSIIIRYARGIKHNGSHFLDLINWLFSTTGRLISSTLVEKWKDEDPTLSLTLAIKDTLKLYLIGSYHNDNCEAQFIEIVGSKGRIYVNHLGKITIQGVIPMKEYPGFTCYSDMDYIPVDVSVALLNAYQHSVRMIDGLDKEPVSEAKNSLEILKLIDNAIILSNK
jgi:predicted dehydrogenase